MKQKAKSHVSSSLCSYFIFHRSQFLSEGGDIFLISITSIKLSLVSHLNFEVLKAIMLILLMVKNLKHMADDQFHKNLTSANLMRRYSSVHTDIHMPEYVRMNYEIKWLYFQ